jgi:rfaE bifunctional protein kinase chain/domain
MTKTAAPEPTRERLLAAIDRMAGTPVLAVADLVLDVFEHGRIGRVSREAPVLILDHLSTDWLPGGGANAVHNLASLGGRPRVVGRVGRDAAGERLRGLLEASGADVSGIVVDPGYRTPEKRRILAGSAHSVQQQVVRLDAGGGPPAAADEALLERVRRAAGGARGALFSDYGFGLLHAGTIGPILEAAGEAGRRAFVDSRRQLRAFPKPYALTPNLGEAEASLGAPVGDDGGRAADAAERLRGDLGAEAVVVTLGSLGMAAATRDGRRARIPVYGTDEVADVTGAGDTVIAAFALASLSGADPLDAALLANYAGGVVVMKRGTATVSPDELRRAVRTDAELETRLQLL